MNTITRDLRYVTRSLLRAPSFSLVAIGSLAVGIAVCAVVFSAAYRLHLRPLPFRHSEHLVRIMESASRACGTSCPDALSASAAADLQQERPRSLEDLALFAQTAVALDATTDRERIAPAAYVEPAVFEILGIQAMHGTALRESDALASAPRVAVLGERVWRRWYGGERAIIGSTIDLDGDPVTVIGVIPADATYPENTEIWLPLAEPDISSLGGSLAALGRLYPSTTVEALLSELDVRAARHQLEGPSGGRGLIAIPEEQWLRGGQGGTTVVLAGAVGLAFLIACTNLGNLFLVRALGRRQAFFIRQAIGATRSRIARQLVTESLVVTAAGLVTGLVFASWGSDAMMAWLGPLFHGSITYAIEPHVVVLLAAASLIVGVIIGLFPMMALPGVRLHAALTTPRSSVSNRAQRAFVFAQVAATLVLVAGAGVLVRSYLETRLVELGLDDRDVVVVPLDALLLEGRSRQVDRIAADAIDRIAHLPPVTTSAAWTISNPFPKSLSETPLTLEDRGELIPDYGEWPRPWPALSINVSPDFHATLGLRLVRGRLFDARDVEGRMPVAIVNEAAARRLWPSEDPVGRRFKIGPATSPDPWMSVVGVVTNSAMPIRAGLGMSLTHDGQTDVSLMYRPLAQSAGEAFGELVIAARVGAKAEGHAGPVRAAIRDGLSLERVPYPTTLRAWMSGDQTIERVRVTAGLLGAFAATALALALMGVYSVVAETVKRRRAELGIRMALGARAGSVVFIVLKDALRVTGAGLLVGVIGAVLAARVGETTLYGNAFARTGMRTGLLYGVDALNPALLIGACTVVLLVAALGGLLPARSATRVDPAETLRQE